MPFEPGMKRPEGAGNPKGNTIKRSLAALATAEARDKDPMAFWCDILDGKYPEATLEHKMAAVKEMARYLYPTMKAVEHSGDTNASSLFDAIISRLDGSK